MSGDNVLNVVHSTGFSVDMYTKTPEDGSNDPLKRCIGIRNFIQQNFSFLIRSDKIKPEQIVFNETNWMGLEIPGKTPASVEFEKLLNLTHNPKYISTLKIAYDSWVASKKNRDFATPSTTLTHDKPKLISCNFARRRGSNSSETQHAPSYIDIGRYAMDICTPIDEYTYRLAMESAFLAYQTTVLCLNAIDTVPSMKKAKQTALSSPSSSRSSMQYAWYALTPFPGHHAGYESYGGFCFFNNAVLAARTLVNNGIIDVANVCILDIDYHMGDGTFDILNNNYKDNNVFKDSNGKIVPVNIWSMHADPRVDYPYVNGETNCTDEQKKHNVVELPLKCSYDMYMSKLDDCLAQIDKCNTNDNGYKFLIVSLGADTLGSDTEALGAFQLNTDSFYDMGQKIRSVCNYNKNWRVIIVQEGGYSPDVPEACCKLVKGLNGF